MVRFARAEGSKGSNKRTLEEATPWSEMVAQKSQKSSKKAVRDVSEIVPDVDGSIEISETNGHSMKNEGTPKSEVVNNNGNLDIEDTVMYVSDAVQKKKKKKDKSDLVKKPEFVLNNEGKRVKVFRDGTERTFFDLPYEDSDRMTRYQSFWVHREVVDSLDELKATLSEGDPKLAMKKMMKAIRKAHKKLRMELVYEQKAVISQELPDQIMKTVKKAIKQKNDRKNEKMVDQISKRAIAGDSKKKEKRKMKVNDEEMLSSLDVENSKPKTASVSKKKDKKKRVTEDSELLSDPDIENSKSKSVHAAEKKEKKKKIMDNGVIPNLDGVKIDDAKKPSKGKMEKNFDNLETNSVCAPVQIIGISSELKFEENEMMTFYDGFWVAKNSVEMLNENKEFILNEIYAARSDGNTGKELTEKEQIVFQRAIKKRKRNENRKLRSLLTSEMSWKLKQGISEFGNAQVWPSKQLGVPGRNLGITYGEDNNMVKFDGFWVKKESAERLEGLRKSLTEKGVSDEELHSVLQKERRKEERALKNDRKNVCFKCRQPGHMMSLCPLETARNSEGLEICFNCGSTEHMARNCSLKRRGSNFSHASCFICGEPGHIAKECPDNPKGLYPNGGCCNTCGSVEHLKRDCPELQQEKELETIKIGLIDGENVEALADLEEDESEPSAKKRKKVKIVKF